MRRPESGPRHALQPAVTDSERVRRARGRERPVERCEACGTQMYGLHCKIVCPNCGYKRDCSDP